ncbi:hypothetical protein J6590_085808 [Homalodisca vitripennis]|nr:hypothetical protein J6590_085808 [Homalodisca vitripennis]
MSSGGMLDRFRYWRWLGNGSSLDDYEFPTFIGVNVGSVSQLALVRNQFGIMLLPYVVGGNVGSVTVLALVKKHSNFGLSRITYGRRWVRLIVFVLVLVRKQESHIVRSNADSPCRRWGCLLDRFRYWRWLGNGSSSDDYEFPTFIGVNVGSVSQLALVKNQVGSEKYRLSSVIGGNIHDLFLY